MSVSSIENKGTQRDPLELREIEAFAVLSSLNPTTDNILGRHSKNMLS